MKKRQWAAVGIVVGACAMLFAATGHTIGWGNAAMMWGVVMVYSIAINIAGRLMSGS